MIDDQPLKQKCSGGFLSFLLTLSYIKIQPCTIINIGRIFINYNFNKIILLAIKSFLK